MRYSDDELTARKTDSTLAKLSEHKMQQRMTIAPSSMCNGHVTALCTQAAGLVGKPRRGRSKCRGLKKRVGFLGDILL